MIRIDDLLPDAWPRRITTALDHWHQGDLIESPPLFWAADPREPLLPFTRDNGDSARDWQIFSLAATDRPPYGAVLSQTCDICEPRPVSPFVDVAPVYDISDSLKPGQDNDIRQHNWNYYVYLTRQPKEEGFYVADLRLSLPLEKGAFAERSPIPGFASQNDLLVFSERVAGRLRRPAYADAVSEFLIIPLERWIRGGYKQAINDGSGRFTDVEEVRLRIEGDRLSPVSVQMVVFEETTLTRDDKAAWRSWRESTKKVIERQANIKLRPVHFSSLRTMNAAEYRELAPVWLRYLGRGPRW
jgi:hypothetical protein